MTTLLFMDLDKKEREKRAQELQSIFSLVLKEGSETLNAERSTLFLLDKETDELWSSVMSGHEEGSMKKIRVPKDKGIVGHVLCNEVTVNVADAYELEYFNQAIDKQTGWRTRARRLFCLSSKHASFIHTTPMCLKYVCAKCSAKRFLSQKKNLKLLENVCFYWKFICSRPIAGLCNQLHNTQCNNF